MPALIALLAVAALATPTTPLRAVAGRCGITHTVYAASEDAGVTLRFVPVGHWPGWLSDVALSLRLPDGRRFDYLPDRGTAPVIVLIDTPPRRDGVDWRPPPPDGPRRSPLGAQTYYALDRRQRFITDVPTRASPPPDAIFLPALAEGLSYRLTPRYRLAPTLFRPVRCERQAAGD